jgi:hypothetical protein
MDKARGICGMRARLRQVLVITCGVTILMFSASSIVPVEAGTYVAQKRRHVHKKKPEAKKRAPLRYSPKAVQRSLWEAGYRVNIDGIIGPQTRAALRQFQSDRGIPPTGEVNSSTLTKLGL